MQTGATTPNNVGSCKPTMLRPFARGEKFDRFQTLRNNTQQHPTTCNRMCKRTQHVTFNNVGSCWSTMLRPFARSLTTPNNTHQRTCYVLHPTMLGVVGQRCVRLYGALSPYFASLTTGQDLGRLVRERGNKSISYLGFSLKQRIAGSHEDTGSSPDFKG